MNHSESLKALDELRVSAADYLRKARESVISFRRDADNAFWRDSKQKEDPTDRLKHNTIITARSYLALFYSEMALADWGEVEEPDWLPWFRSFVSQQPFIIRSRKIYSASKKRVEKYSLINFELSHLPDLILCKTISNKYWERHGLSSEPIVRNNKHEKRTISSRLLAIINNNKGTKNINDIGEVKLSELEDGSNHYFVTLHLLRGLSILGIDPNSSSKMETILNGVRAFCLKQAFYGQRGIRHKQDAFRLAFAGTVYCLYEPHPERDLICAIVEALEKCQQDNGMWPASHPIFRKDKEPWHIASHEIALCLTWLYFQAKVPDDARLVLLQMMERYFNNSVVATYMPAKPGPYHGWYDDHSIGEDLVVGWATAIVCHFLAGYYWVLCDWINRRVFEELGIERHASGYLIADSSPTERMSRIWQQKEVHTVWPDLPPFRWQNGRTQGLTDEAARKIRSEWTDPGFATGGKKLVSSQIASEILAPVYGNPGGRPDRNHCSVLLAGKPGSRKSSFVTQVAEALKWPRVSVPGSVIFEKGFDYLETRANEVFSLLNMLTSCVIFFDEFEEFLRKRPQSDNSDSNILESQTRTIAAFITSSMLTRMQDLHDQARCLIFLATNHEAQIDDAAKRPGRIDCAIEIGHPKKQRILDFLSAPPSGCSVICTLMPSQKIGID